MRKGKRFTPERLQRWAGYGRGIGTKSGFTPWHQVTRDDPSSQGRSHILHWPRLGRLHHLLSDLELVGFAFATMLADLEDLREQFPLSVHDSVHELDDYEINRGRRSMQPLPGTVKVASNLGVKHPMIGARELRMPWIMTTDLLITRRNADGERSLLAVSLKYADKPLSSRQLELLTIEKAYWEARNTPWLYITPSVFNPRVATSLRHGLGGAIGTPAVPKAWTQRLCSMAARREVWTFELLLQRLARSIPGAMNLSNATFWQAVWAGKLPLNMNWDARISDPVRLLHPTAFWQQNPIASGRSAWFA